MIRFYLLSLLLAFAVTAKAQKRTCITIKGDAHNGKFQQANLSTSFPDQADMTQREMVASAWTCVAQNQDTCNFMALLRFDVSAIPANTVISVTTQRQKVLPQTTRPAQNFSINVTDFVQAWVQDPSQNFGMLLRMKTEDYYNSMIFNSGQAPQNLQPRLEITYEIVQQK